MVHGWLIVEKDFFFSSTRQSKKAVESLEVFPSEVNRVSHHEIMLENMVGFVASLNWENSVFHLKCISESPVGVARRLGPTFTSTVTVQCGMRWESIKCSLCALPVSLIPLLKSEPFHSKNKSKQASP